MKPFVSVIIPCYNEERTIALLLQALDAQTYPHERMEVVIADGMSSDATRERIAAFAASHPALSVRVVDNPRRNIPAALNRALDAAQGEIIVRLDAHSVPNREYVQRSVAALQAGRGDNVGGVWQIQPGADTWIGRGIAAAAAHPLGVGDARYRYATQAAAVDTVPFGAFYRTLVERIGAFDERLLSNEDYEFNTRIRQAGGTVWLDPGIQARYFARPTLRSLARQYWRYGFWKWRMLRRYPQTLRWRQALPPVFVLSLLGLPLAGIWFPAAHWLWLLQIAAYLLLLGIVKVQIARQERSWAVGVGAALAVAVMQLTWGSAFLWSMLQSLFRKT
ncbi:MAG: glycosyltransferase family 2 protein [Anaerolineae bacterium]|nr:MAG: glycosyltransferase family 2 protein [Anaerolineae bacterium]